MEQENNKEAETPVKTLPESNMNKQKENKEAVEAPEEASQGRLNKFWGLR